ncbi:PilZ domain-containing protein [Vibrio hannami]|uniref:PilZ domain-containing protein n=1 Tax=Vibrio hannami TaxID=2717094 RepID=UPI00240FFF63|nr:PilZ domain-containing protein [Vibrio hannami]MDG3084743.1 PilZ domain-containing protein [Vibrio hannami]
MKQDLNHERRQFYRLRYPKAERPSIELSGQIFQVCEISELGMRLLFRSEDPVPLGVKINGVIHFSDSKDVEIEGIALRQHSGEVAVKLSKGISLKRMTDEQLRLLREDPGYYSGLQMHTHKIN